jgi:hypothetical protein
MDYQVRWFYETPGGKSMGMQLGTLATLVSLTGDSMRYGTVVVCNWSDDLLVAVTGPLSFNDIELLQQALGMTGVPSIEPENKYHAELTFRPDNHPLVRGKRSSSSGFEPLPPEVAQLVENFLSREVDIYLSLAYAPRIKSIPDRVVEIISASVDEAS